MWNKQEGITCICFWTEVHSHTNLLSNPANQCLPCI